MILLLLLHFPSPVIPPSTLSTIFLSSIFDICYSRKIRPISKLGQQVLQQRASH